MKWLKLFEDYNSDWQMHKQNDSYVYFFKVAGNFFQLTFTPVKNLSGFWSADYIEETDKWENIFSGKTALKLFPILSKITDDFIKQEYPDIIIMSSIPLPNETGIFHGLNKRARFNYEHIKKIQGYHLQYFNQYFKYFPGATTVYGKSRTTTIGFLIKNGTSKSPEDWFAIPKLSSSQGEEVYFPVEP
jgi:hypothetical protein